MNRLLLGYSPDLDVFDHSPATMFEQALVHCGVAFDTENTEQAASLLDVAGRPALTALLSRWIRRSASLQAGSWRTRSLRSWSSCHCRQPGMYCPR